MGTAAIFQTYLDRLSKCFETGDYRIWSDAVSLPLIMVMRDGPISCETVQDLSRDFRAYVGLVKAYEITTVRKRLLGFEMMGPSNAMLRFETDMLNGRNVVVPAFPTTAMVAFRRGAWRASAFMGCIGVKDWRDHLGPPPNNLLPFTKPVNRADKS